MHPWRTGSTRGGTCRYRPASAARTYGATPARSRSRRTSCGRLAENLGHLPDEPLVAARIGRLGAARARREDVVAAGGNIGCELLPRLAELPLDPVPDHGVTDR